MAGGGGGPAGRCVTTVRIRQARAGDAAAIGRLTAEAFEPAWLAAARSPHQPYGRLTARVAEALLARSAAAGAARVAAWADGKAAARAPPASSSEPASPARRRAVARQAAAASRARRTAVLVAEEEGADGLSTSSARLVGAAALLRVRAAAALPPPAPTAAPVVAYVADLAVVADARGRGIATSLLERAARRARFWGDPALWLHAPTPLPDGGLYARAGFAAAFGGGGRGGREGEPPRARALLVRPLLPVGESGCSLH